MLLKVIGNDAEHWIVDERVSTGDGSGTMALCVGFAHL